MVNLTDVFIRRPILASAISLFILLIGAVAFFVLPLREYPKVDENVINITVTYTGATPEVMESYVTTQIENAVGSVDGIDYIDSQSSYGFSQITIHFNLGYDINTAVADITNEISSVRWQLPVGIQDPIISKVDPNSQPTMYLSFQGEGMTDEALNDYLLRVVQPQLQVITGVGSAEVFGSKKYAMRLWLDPYAMAARNVTPAEVNQAIINGEFLSATGEIKNKLQQFSINAVTNLETAKEFNDLVIKSDSNHLTQLKDIGRAELGEESSDFLFMVNNKPGALLGITPKTNANPLDVSTKVIETLKSLQKYYPPNFKSKILLDYSVFIHSSINEIKKTLIEAVICVMLIMFLFLGSFRTLLIPAVTIPLSLISVFAVMLALGYSLNTMTILALVLAVGMVVDDSIVVAENIHRHISLGKSPVDAAIIGAREIQFAIISITFTLAAVYAPIGFTSGLTKALFKEFAFTLAATVIISGFFALILSPMMCSKIMKSEALESKFSLFVHHIFSKITASYGLLLQKLLNIRFVVFIFLALAFAACYFAYAKLPHDLAPKEDVGWIYTYFQAPAAANFEYTKKYAKQINNVYKFVPEISNYGIFIDPNQGGSFAVLKPWNERKRDINQIIAQLQAGYTQIPGLQLFAYNPQMLPGSSSFLPIEVAVQSTGSYEELNTVIEKLKLAIKNNPKIINIDTGLKLDLPQLDIQIDRKKAGTMGVSIQDINSAINIAFGEPWPTQFILNGRSYYVVPELDEQYKDRFDAINNLQVRTSSGELVPLSNLITIKESVHPRTLTHFQQLRYAELQASLAPGYSIGEALNYVEKTARGIIPSHMKLDYLGQSRQFMQDTNKMLYTFVLAIVFIFLLLAAQFESFRDPLIVLFSVPLSLLGALLTLLCIKGSLNIYSEIGIITLIGLVTKHGILMVEFANKLRTDKLALREAIVEAAKIRLRPILMTTLAMILGALPLALATGAGAISRQQIGWVIVGGMLVGTMFTLFVVPVMYTYLAERNRSFL
jgi:multidrug efflux pump